MNNKLVEEAPYHTGYEDVGFKLGDFRNVDTPKPTAWIREDGVIAFHPKTDVDSQGFKWFPLYTHPVKELTDEVIEQVRVAIMGAAYWCADENMPEAYNAVKVCCGQVLGILDKAQEK